MGSGPNESRRHATIRAKQDGDPARHVRFRLAVQGLAQRPLDDRRHLAPKIGLVPPGIVRNCRACSCRD